MRFDELGKGQIRQALAKRIYSKWEAIGHGLISSVFFFFFKQICCCVDLGCCEVQEGRWRAVRMLAKSQ